MRAMRIPAEVVDLALKHQLSVRMHPDTGAYEIWNNKHMLACSRDTTEGAITVLQRINRRIEDKELITEEV